MADNELVEVQLAGGTTFKLNRHRMIELMRREADGEGRPLPAFARWHPGNGWERTGLLSLNREHVTVVRAIKEG